MPTFDDILEAQERIARFVHRTPVLTCRTLDEMAGRRLFVKCENFQKVGAFKYRGATNAVRKLTDEVAARGVVTHSSGNHAQALALAAKVRGIAAHIVIPANAPVAKRRAVETYGGIICECETTQESRDETAARIVRETGGTLIHPNNDPDVIAGQGTCALEFVDQIMTGRAGFQPAGRNDRGNQPVDAIIAPIGGGGLMSGTCIAASGSISQREGTVRLFGAEPAGADDAARSLAAGKLVPLENPDTIADGLRTGLGSNTWPIIRDHVERIITVTDEESIRAMRLVWERMKIVIEPSAAVAVAAVLSEEFRAIEGIESIGIILSGGNVDLERLPWVK